MKPIKRKIHFLKVACDNNTFPDILTQVDAIGDNPRMYSFINSQGGGIYLKSIQVQNDMYKGELGRLRMNGLPRLGTNGVRSTAELNIAENQGLAEVTHFIYFEESQILAFEMNYAGPRASHLEWHLIDRMNELNGEPLQLRLQQIFDESTFNLMSDGAELKVMEMAVPKRSIGNLAAYDEHIYQAFKNAADFNETGTIELILRFGSRKRNTGLPVSQITESLQRLPGELNDTFDKLKIKVKPDIDAAAIPLDLLQNKLTVGIELQPVGRAREVSSVEIFRLMHEAYQSKRDILQRLARHEELD